MQILRKYGISDVGAQFGEKGKKSGKLGGRPKINRTLFQNKVLKPFNTKL